ncbi:MAG TPA: hypothetical protein VI198_02610, partial [Candidatus Eisenbacteria bacterium]
MRAALLFVLVALPLLFVRGVADAFEPHKAAFAAAGAAVLAALALAPLLARAVSQGVPDALRSAAAASRRSLRNDPAGVAILIFLVSSALSTIFSLHPGVSLHGSASRPAGFVTALTLTAFYFASRRLAASPRWLTHVALAVTIAAAAASLYAVAQLLGIDPVGWSGGATFDGRLRVPGTLGHPNTFGAFLAMSLPLTLLLASRTPSLAGRAAALGAASLSIFVLSATLSRGAWLGAAAAGIAFGAIRIFGERFRAAASASPGRSRRGRIALLVAAALIAFLLPLATPMGAG